MHNVYALHSHKLLKNSFIHLNILIYFSGSKYKIAGDKDHYFYYNNFKKPVTLQETKNQNHPYFKRPWNIEESRRIKQSIKGKGLLRWAVCHWLFSVGDLPILEMGWWPGLACSEGLHWENKKSAKLLVVIWGWRDNWKLQTFSHMVSFSHSVFVEF